MHKCNVSESLTDWEKETEKLQVLGPHERYLAGISGIISSSPNLIFEEFPIERTKGGWRKGHLAQISFKEELKFLLAMKPNHRNFPADIKNVKKKGSSCN